MLRAFVEMLIVSPLSVEKSKPNQAGFTPSSSCFPVQHQVGRVVVWPASRLETAAFLSANVSHVSESNFGSARDELPARAWAGLLPGADELLSLAA